MDMEAKSSVSFTVLSCSVQEEDLDKKESCTWQWDDLTVETRPEERRTLSECDALNRKGYDQKQETVFLVQRSPLQTIRVGVLGSYMQDYKLPYRTQLPVPLFVPNKLRTPEELSAEDLHFQQKTPTNGLYPDKQDIIALINSLPKVRLGGRFKSVPLTFFLGQSCWNISFMFTTTVPFKMVILDNSTSSLQMALTRQNFHRTVL